ncbi:MAG: gamma-glutamylcyclotransferase [Alphaproteobacteria bacterium]|nr:gamma-glutamylcyclotransferase [Alphaproteobacteria bacterium]MBV9248774.1 gamma-glutamylcyclotransferase [Acetobacteraceae bacterium]MBV9376943.1 gamma-glutamylcyclotransferase [Alphaproteobacteria bacterium]
MLRFLLKLNALLASCWTFSRLLYRLHGTRLIGPPSEPVWYFAYGANMHDSAFRGWRGMRPLEWRPARVRGYRLRFNLGGRLRGRAAPANLAEDPRAEVWGVLYRITRRDLVRLDATEGVPWWRYRSLWLEAEDVNGDMLCAVTYIAQGDEDDCRPSLRYLTLIREGARAHGLPDHYIRLLEQVEHGKYPAASLGSRHSRRPMIPTGRTRRLRD